MSQCMHERDLCKRIYDARCGYTVHGDTRKAKSASARVYAMPVQNEDG